MSGRTSTRVAGGIAGAIVALSLGCPPSVFPSAEGQWEFVDEGLVAEPHVGFSNAEVLLVGGAVCPQLHDCAGCDGGEDAAALFDECVEPTLDGPARVSGDGACLQFDGAGEVRWRLTAVDCDEAFPGFAPIDDEVVFGVVEPDGVDGEIHQWAEAFALAFAQPGPGESFPADLVQPAGEPFRVLAGEPVLLFARLVDGASGRTAAWRADDGAVTVVPRRGDARIVEETQPGFLAVALDEGAEADVVVELGERRWTAGTLVGVAPSAVASLEVVVVYGTSGDENGMSTAPWAARAMVRDADGDVIFGVPVQWSVRGERLSISAGPFPADGQGELPGADYAWVADACVPERSAGEHEAWLTARFRGHTGRAEVRWSVVESTPADDDWEEPATCTGCSCRLGGGGQPGAVAAPALALLAALAWRSRGRRSTR